MTFADELKSYLLQVQQGDMQVEPRLIELDTAWVRGVAVQLFERLERQEGSNLSSKKLEQTFNEWMEPSAAPWEGPEPLAEKFAARLARLLQGSFLKGASRSEIEHYVRLGMALQIGVEEKIPSLSRRLELKRLAVIASSWRDTTEMLKADWRTVSKYALEIRAVRKSESRLELTPIGSVFLGLAGRDAIQWLLSVEVAQSTGPRDQWRLSRDDVTALLKKPESSWHYASDHDLSPCSWSTLRRLSAMGLMSLVEEDDPEAASNGYDGYELLETGIQALKALAEPAGTPFSVLAATLSNDEALATLAGLPGKQAGAVRFQASAEATALQARLVAHEIRNALLPVQSALDAFYEGAVGQQLEAQVGRLRPRIDSGIERVLSFVRELLRTSELATQPPEPFELNLAIEEARASFASNLVIQVTGANLGSSTVEGYRGRFVLALVNLFRNAEQAGAQSVVLDLKWDEGGQGLLLTLDDDGSGVPVEQRERIFQPGVSLRGGTGVGLALVREVIESEMHGKVACQEAPGGGARFLMRLPLKERRSR
jgi:signal transduction histidine kinase